MKKMNLKKMLTMAMAAMMVMTTMSSSISAEETIGMMEDKVTIFTYNQDTKSFDVEYKDADEVQPPMTRAATCNFSQNIKTEFSTITYTNPKFPSMPTYFQLSENNNAFYLNLTNYDQTTNVNYYIRVYDEGAGEGILGYDSIVRVSTPQIYVGNLPLCHSYSIQLRKTGSTYKTSGNVQEFVWTSAN